MRRGMWLTLAMAVAVGAVAVGAPRPPPPHEKGKEFTKKTGYELEVVTIPYQGYEAKYLAALIGKSGAPDFFNGMTHQWCGQYDFCDPMPADLYLLIFSSNKFYIAILEPPAQVSRPVHALSRLKRI